MDVLIVEDDDAMASALDAAVVSAGHTASRVARGADALLEHRRFEVILLDLGLPDMDGLDVLLTPTQAVEMLEAGATLIGTSRSAQMLAELG